MAKMGGILGGGMGQGAGVGPVQYLPDDSEEANVSPEEQQAYDAFVNNAMEILYTEDGQVQPQVLQKLSTGKKPLQTMAQTLVWLVTIIEEDAKRNNMNIENDVLFHASKEILEQLVEIAEAAKLHDFKQAEMQGIWYNALDLYREANSDETGRFNPEEAKAAFEQLNEADKEGRANEVVPGFERDTENAITLAMADQNPVEQEDEVEDGGKRLNRRDLGRG